MLSGNYGTSFVLCWQAILLFVTPPFFYTTTPHMLVDLSAPRFMPVPVSLVFVVEYHAQFYSSSFSLFLSSFSPFHFISLSTSLYVFLLLSPSPLSDCCWTSRLPSCPDWMRIGYLLIRPRRQTPPSPGSLNRPDHPKRVEFERHTIGP